MLVSIGKASTLLGVSVSTLRLWERMQKIKPFCRTKGNHRRYRIRDLKETIGIQPESDQRLTLGYNWRETSSLS
jgi:DNA-binding transcriptional MerR regulator